MRSIFNDTLGRIRRQHEASASMPAISQPCADRQAWLDRCDRKKAQRDARLSAMRQAVGSKPNAAIDAAIKQIQNRAEHSR